MKYKLTIKADYNDADYIYNDVIINDINDMECPNVKLVYLFRDLSAIITKMTNGNKWTHNWVIDGGMDKEVLEMYGEYFTEEQIELMVDFVPLCEEGYCHTIEYIKLTPVCSIEDIY